MRRRDLSLGFGAGLAAGVAAAAVLTGFDGRGTSRAAAQPPPVTAAPRFQVSAWSYPATASSGGAVVSPASFGAYALDTRSGKVWLIRQNGNPEPLGELK